MSNAEDKTPAFVAPSAGVIPAALLDLNRPTPDEQVHQRKALGKGGAQVMRDGKPLMLDYVNARYVLDTLDDVVGPANWQSKYEDTPGGIRAGIGILVNFGDHVAWVWKWDAGSPSSIEPVKGSHSDALKRAAVQWGIARDLYDARDGEGDGPANRAPDEDDEDDRPVRERRPQGGYGSSNSRQSSGGGGQRAQKVQMDPDEARWSCPEHAAVEAVPAGRSQRTGNAYPAFFACPERGCDEKGPRLNERELRDLGWGD